MAQIKLSKAFATMEYDGFEGIDSSKTFSGKGGIKGLTDFRLRLDGALERRGGLEQFASFTGNVRAVYQLSERTLLLLVDHTVYLFYLYTQAAKPLSMVGSSTGEASFFSFNGNVYLLDGNKLYVMSDEVFLPVFGYAPLYGKEWHPILGGNVNEPLNLVSRYVRISFRVHAITCTSFHLPFFTHQINHVTRNGIDEDMGLYALSTDGYAVYYDGSYVVGDVVELYLTISNIYADESLICSCKSAAVYGDGSAGADKVFVAFYNGSNQNAIYPSSVVPDDQLTLCKKAFGKQLTGLYVSEADTISANDGKGNITGVCQKDDGLMVFTADRAFMLTTDASGSNHFVRVSLGTGCSSPRGAIVSDDTPITVSFYGIFKWDPSSYEEGEYRAKCISRPVQDLLSDGFFTSAIAYHYRKKGELWFCDPSDSRGTVLIYSLDGDYWYSFSGIGAEFFFEHNGEIGFIKGDKAFIFSMDKLTDTTEEERSVCARLESGLISFGSFNEKKRLSRCIIRTSPGASLSLTVTDAEGKSERFDLKDGSGERMGYIEKRLRLRRSRHYSLSIETENNTVIYGITLVAVD